MFIVYKKSTLVFKPDSDDIETINIMKGININTALQVKGLYLLVSRIVSELTIYKMKDNNDFS